MQFVVAQVNDLLPTEAFVEAEELLELAAASYLAVGFFISCHAAPAQCAHDGIGRYCQRDDWQQSGRSTSVN